MKIDTDTMEAQRKIRLRCLKLALGCGHPDEPMSSDDVLRLAESFYRYVTEGKTVSAVEKIRRVG